MKAMEDVKKIVHYDENGLINAAERAWLLPLEALCVRLVNAAPSSPLPLYFPLLFLFFNLLCSSLWILSIIGCSYYSNHLPLCFIPRFFFCGSDIISHIAAVPTECLIGFSPQSRLLSGALLRTSQRASVLPWTSSRMRESSFPFSHLLICTRPCLPKHFLFLMFSLTDPPRSTRTRLPNQRSIPRRRPLQRPSRSCPSLTLRLRHPLRRLRRL